MGKQCTQEKVNELLEMWESPEILDPRFLFVKLDTGESI